MKKFNLSVHQYRQKLIDEFGWADPEQVKRYAVARKKYRIELRLKQEFGSSWNTPEGNRAALTRLEKRGGCKPCEKRQLEKFTKDNTVS